MGDDRQRVLELISRREQLEAEIQRYGQILQTNGVGMEDSLVDENDFPRSDIDVYQVRNARHQIICLQNDHKALTKQIEEGLHSLLPNTGGHSSDMNGTNGNYSHMNGHDPAAAARLDDDSKCIVQVNFVSPGSPAESAGIQVGDDIIEFGSLNATNFKALTQIAEIVQHSVNTAVSVKIRRSSGESVELTLVPRTWSGRGLLGCNIIPHPDFA